jgi:hypothetical protein
MARKPKQPNTRKPDIGQPPIRKDGLQLDEHRSFQERFWTAERWAWITFGLLLLVALAGLTGGGGLLAHATSVSQAGEFEYPRISRWEATDAITVTFAAGGAEHRLSLSHPFAEHFQIEDIQPSPEQTIAAGDAEIMVFATQDQAPAKVTIHIRPLKPGIASYQVGLDAVSTAVTTVVLP